MRTIYVDSEGKCHAANDGTMQAVETHFFNGKCDAFIEGYCCERGEGWLTLYPWKDFSALDEAQRSFDQEMIAAYELLINELYEEAL